MDKNLGYMRKPIMWGRDGAIRENWFLHLWSK
jgi:hypothetical protein